MDDSGAGGSETGDAFDDVVAAVRKRVDPGPEERADLQRAARRLCERARTALASLPVEADVVQVGSTARGTWTSGDRDVDLFVRFPPALDRDRLEEYGLRIGREVLPAGHEEYAEHPYMKGTFEGYDVDLVPCYRVDSAQEIRSAVDRTPFHTTYLKSRIDADLAGAVRLAKQFLKGIGAYGSDLRTRGFSGYLTELLLLEYGGFRAFLERAAAWRPPVELDPEDHADAAFDDPLAVVDPTDPERNVAAVVSAENVARLQHHARAFLADPRETVFFPSPPDPLDAEAVREHVERRRTTPLAIRFDAPDLVEDQLYPQLRRSRQGLIRGLETEGFRVLRSDAWAATSGAETDAGREAGQTEFGDAVLFFELAVAELPAVERHGGPPVAAREHAKSFYGTYEDADGSAGADVDVDADADTDVDVDVATYGPFLDGERYAVEREREVTTAPEFVRERLFEVALGAHVESALEAGYDLLVGEAVAGLAPAFGTDLARYFDPSP
jgi:tRNA nucleotidyltransferase (CCA-adding enzyme)